jgi:hypothetical protein
MSAAPAAGAAPTTKATTTEDATTTPKSQKLAAALEEDDEFEDFPVEGLHPSLNACFGGLCNFMCLGRYYVLGV